MSDHVGPVLPWQLQQAETKGSQVILQFQAAAQAKESRIADGIPEAEGFLDSVGGRRVEDVVDFSLLRSWLTICESRHGNACCPTAQPDDQHPGPSTVIDCQDMCLRKNTPRNRYIALSYVWGAAKVFRHIKESSDYLHQPGSLQNLEIPATIQDAIALVSGLGERYLWVDSLCIVQDDFATQAAAISSMDSIYADALFTIIAAHGDSANAGLPGVRKGSRVHLQQRITTSQGDILSTIDSGSLRSGISRSTWNTRAWTYQERVFSKRTLIFMKGQAYWQC
ncbi:HET-domain-containing protein, partial [Saccharata proteae CBS 121410]